MPKTQLTFKRVELKYLVTEEKYEYVLSKLKGKFTPDLYGKNTIFSLYLDTPDHRIIRDSIDAKNHKKPYKEKLRIRCYNTPGSDDTVYIEIKKKYKGTVYKRREAMALSAASSYIDTGIMPIDSQIMREIDYAMKFYSHPKPQCLICYEREAFFSKDDPSLRITFDTNLRYRATDLSPTSGSHGKIIQPSGLILMEIKSNGGMPPYLAKLLSDLEIYPVSFSKYATAYKDSQNLN